MGHAMTTSYWAARLLAVGLALVSSSAGAADLFDSWINGTDRNEPAIQVQRVDPDTFVIRQSFHVTTQAPFLYLLFGENRVLLLDTGDGGKIRPTIDALIADWLTDHNRKAIPLVVAHSHSHSDHHAGDAEFADRPRTTVVGLRPSDVAQFFKIAHWPDDIAQFDLGGRVLDIIPAPGHEPAHIVIFDRKTEILFTGDVLLAGHVLIPFDQLATFRKSVDRIQTFIADKDVAYALGTHVEMARIPGKAYGFDATSHPDEHVLELPASAMTELQSGLKTLGESHKPQVHDDFIILPVPPQVMAPYEFHG